MLRFSGFVSVLMGLLLSFCAMSLMAAGPDSTPQLRLEPSRHFAMISRMDVDRPERYAVTASADKTARVWDIRDGKLLRTIRPPIGKGNEGQLFAVAISPDGELIAVGGWTGYEWQKKYDIYLFQRSNGHLLRRIRGLPGVITDLTFSKDGRKLAVAVARNGIRVFDPFSGRLLISDTQYSGASYSVDFNQQGQLVSVSYDGLVRLYDAQLKLKQRYRTQGGKLVFRARFSPDGRKIALVFHDSATVEVLATHNLSRLPLSNAKGVDNGYLLEVAWSVNGRQVYVGGTHNNGSGIPVLVWQQNGMHKALNASQDTVMGVYPLRDGGLLYASADPALGRLDAVGRVLWKRTSGKLSFMGYKAQHEFKLSADGRQVWFNFKHERESNSRVIKGAIGWNLLTQTLVKNPAPNLQPSKFKAPGLDIRDWDNEYKPIVNGQSLLLERREMARSLAIAPNNRNFALGTSWRVRYFADNGQQRWKTPVSAAWAVNISQDGRWVVAALGDGTIRWYETQTGKERLAFYLHPDQQRWIAWTPQGFYAASSENAERFMGYHLNNGADQAAQFVRVDRLKTVYARADLVAKALDPNYPQLAQQALQRAGNVRALLRADRLPPLITVMGGKRQFNVQGQHFALPLEIKNQGGGIGRIEYRIAGKVYGDPAARGAGAHSPGGKGIIRKKRSFTLPHGRTVMDVVAFSSDNKVISEPVQVVVNVNNPVRQRPSLHVLSIGVTDYADDSLDLKYAASDAQAFADTLEQHTGPAIYQHINKRVLLDQDVNLHRIRNELARMAKVVKPQDVFVLYMAGHGMALDGRYHFLPQNLRYSGNAAVRQHGLSDEKLRQWLQPIKAKKNLLVLDTCNAGKSIHTLAMARGGNSLEDKVAIGNLMESTGFAVLAASTSQQQALAGIVDHRTKKGHGLFTNSLLNGLRGAADRSNDRRVSIRELDQYIHQQVPRLSQQKWSFKQFPMSQVTGDDFVVSRRLH